MFLTCETHVSKQFSSFKFPHIHALIYQKQKYMQHAYFPKIA